MKGIAVFWPWPKVDIPHGWQECDGTNGTPDMRGRMAIGANATYPQGTSGGLLQHGHTGTAQEETDELGSGSDVEGYDTNPQYSLGTVGHCHQLTIDDGGALPPWYAGFWIMKM